MWDYHQMVRISALIKPSGNSYLCLITEISIRVISINTVDRPSCGCFWDQHWGRWNLSGGLTDEFVVLASAERRLYLKDKSGKSGVDKRQQTKTSLWFSTLDLDVGHIAALVAHQDIEGSQRHHHLQLNDLSVCRRHQGGWQETHHHDRKHIITTGNTSSRQEIHHHDRKCFIMTGNTSSRQETHHNDRKCFNMTGNTSWGLDQDVDFYTHFVCVSVCVCCTDWIWLMWSCPSSCPRSWFWCLSLETRCCQTKAMPTESWWLTAEPQCGVRGRERWRSPGESNRG